LAVQYGLIALAISEVVQLRAPGFLHDPTGFCERQHRGAGLGPPFSWTGSV